MTSRTHHTRDNHVCEMKRDRRFAKSHGGCQNCRNRKIKCDEGIPLCQMCRRSGIECPGYTRPLRWSRKHEKHGTAVSASAIQSRQRRSNHFQPAQEGLSPSEPLDMFASLSEPSPNFSNWVDLELIGSDSRSAYEDAASLMCQDLPGVTSSSFFGSLAFLNQGASSEAHENLSPPQSLNLGTFPENESSSREAVPPANQLRTNQRRRTRSTSDDRAEQRGTGSRALLHTFYRLSSATNHLPGLSDHDFVGYYFKHVSRLISCFDSEMNTFHTLVLNHWSTSSTIFYTIQSMAIAHISNWYPYMAATGIAKRSHAWRSLQRDLQMLRVGCDELRKVLLSLTLLGISASWQHGSNLGLQYLCIARNLIIHGQLQYNPFGGRAVAEDIDDFWADTLVYWEMLASFVDPVPIISFDGHGMPSLDNGLKRQGPVMPHPWTGVVTELYFVLAEVGRVWRRRRKTSAAVNSDHELGSHELDRRWLQNLEEYLLAIEIPSAESILDYKDSSTSKLHLIRTAEACKGICLLEIYRLCPELFYNRINEKSTNGQLPFSIPHNRPGAILEFDLCLTAIAVHCLNLIREVPLSSGASRLQPLLLVACASQLRLSDSVDDLGTDEEESQDQDNGTSDRFAAEERMLALSRKFPQAPILRATDIIKETWERLDAGEDAHWIVVMHEKELQTLLG